MNETKEWKILHVFDEWIFYTGLIVTHLLYYIFLKKKKTVEFSSVYI